MDSKSSLNQTEKDELHAVPLLMTSKMKREGTDGPVGVPAVYSGTQDRPATRMELVADMETIHDRMRALSVCFKHMYENLLTEKWSLEEDGWRDFCLYSQASNGDPYSFVASEERVKSEVMQEQWVKREVLEEQWIDETMFSAYHEELSSGASAILEDKDYRW